MVKHQLSNEGEGFSVGEHPSKMVKCHLTNKGEESLARECPGRMAKGQLTTEDEDISFGEHSTEMSKCQLTNEDEDVSAGECPTEMAEPEVAGLWNEDHWVEDKIFQKQVIRMIPKQGFKKIVPFPSVVRKIEGAGKKLNSLRQYEEPKELQFLQTFRSSNRIMEPFHIEYLEDTEEWAMVFEERRLGSLQHWRTREFQDKTAPEPIPELHLWRFLVNMTQALSIVHLQNGWDEDSKQPGTVIHRDIKPLNILVASHGEGYPSFMLHDFGLSYRVLTEQERKRRVFCGTYSWQPPEAPLINTPAADVWSIGACLHYLAFGDFLYDSDSNWLENMDPLRKEAVLNDYSKYQGSRCWFMACVPRMVTSIDKGLESRTQNPVSSHGSGAEESYRPEYSQRLDYWMKQLLDFDPEKRVTVERLMEEMIPEARAKLLELGGLKALENLDLVFYDEPTTISAPWSSLFAEDTSSELSDPEDTSSGLSASPDSLESFELDG